MPARALRLRFDPDQEHQQAAVAAVVRLFEGFPRLDTSFRLSEDVVANVPPDTVGLDEAWLLDNLRAAQRASGLPVDDHAKLAVDDGMVLEGAGDESWRHPSFTVEMETGTGKTYVYLRTIHELRRQYGFGKFVIVVPSVAIYEGVVKNFAVTRAHFAALYGNEPVNLVRYDGAQLSRLRGYATQTSCEVLLMTRDAFNKAAGRGANNFYKQSEKLPGERRPYQWVQATRPIVILDEPQNMEGEQTKEALRTLHPLVTLRYSATHRTSPNLVYRLTPFDAFQRELVKRIQVAGVTEVGDDNHQGVTLQAVERKGKTTLRARLATHVLEGGRAKPTTLTLGDKENLFDRTRNERHKVGWTVKTIDARDGGSVEFENGVLLRAGAGDDRPREEVFRAQIRETLERHAERQARLRAKGVKVLSLFFVDRVASYTAADGLVRRLFDEEFRRLGREWPEWRSVKPESVRRAYFASRKEKNGTETAVDIGLDEDDRKKDERELAKAAYELIMKGREQLLGFDEPVAFIFAHSALKEGWDNPNVFQICTLNQTVSEVKKRQEIGRGLRLCVDQNGDRVPGDDVNVLTVVANQSYASYADDLQREYVRDGDASGAPPKPSDARREKARRRDALFVAHPDFNALWDQLAQRVRYRIAVDPDALVDACRRALDAAAFPTPKIVIQTGEFVVHRYKFTLQRVRGGKARLQVDTENTAGETQSRSWDVGPKDDVGKQLADPRLREFKVLEVYPDEPAPKLVFENEVTLYQAEPQTFESAQGRVVREQQVRVAEVTYPVPNLVARAAAATGLTRATVNRVFKALSDETKRKVFRNPEGFAGTFTAVVREVLAKHVADRIVFELDGGREDWDLDELFPAEKSFPQKELLDAGPAGLYDRVQEDSGVEKAFVARLRDDKAVVLYFKFPPTFKIRLPKLIGNYNPDWGIVRRGEDGRTTLHLVRETKGSERIEQLQWAHERRKIECAEKYFAVSGVDYRPVTPETVEWWRPWAVAKAQRGLGLRAPGR